MAVSRPILFSTFYIGVDWMTINLYTIHLLSANPFPSHLNDYWSKCHQVKQLLLLDSCQFSFLWTYHFFNLNGQHHMHSLANKFHITSYGVSTLGRKLIQITNIVKSVFRVMDKNAQNQSSYVNRHSNFFGMCQRNPCLSIPAHTFMTR